MRQSIFAAVLVACAIVCGSCLAQEGEWSSAYPSPQFLESGPNAFIEFDDGSGEQLYAGGFFEVAGGVSCPGVARWDGERWEAMSSDGPDSVVTSLAVFDDGNGTALFVGGRFTSVGELEAHYIAKWDGTSWHDVGGGMDDRVDALWVHEGALYAGGKFTMAGGEPASFVARWDGDVWSSVGAGLAGTGSGVLDLITFQGDLVAAGHFDLSGGDPVIGVARWDGSTWSEIGNAGTETSCLGVDVDAGLLYAGGSFRNIGGIAAKRIAVWDGKDWSALGEGIGENFQSVYDIEVFDDGNGKAVFAAGQFESAGGIEVENIARWNGFLWSAMGSGCSTIVRTLLISDIDGEPALYIGGSFREANDVGVRGFTRWRNGGWDHPGPGFTDHVHAFGFLNPHVDGMNESEFLVGGDFTWADGQPAIGLVRQAGEDWEPANYLADPGTVYVIKMTPWIREGTRWLYVGGHFLTADSQVVHHIARVGRDNLGTSCRRNR